MLGVTVVVLSLYALGAASMCSSQRCLAEGCYRNPHYGVSRAVDPNSKAQFCTLHKAPGMENVNGGRCAGSNCSKQPRFAMPGNRGKFCSKHREDGMVDVLYTPCATAGCIKHPHFGYTDGGPRYCAQHRAEGMVDVKHRRCAVKGCRRDRLQMLIGPRKRGKFCDLHHTEEEDELSLSDRPTPTKRAARSPSDRHAESYRYEKRGRNTSPESAARESIASTARGRGSSRQSFEHPHYPVSQEDSEYSEQPPSPALRGLMTVAAANLSDKSPPHQPSFAADGYGPPSRASWETETFVEVRDIRGGRSSIAPHYPTAPTRSRSGYAASTRSSGHPSYDPSGEAYYTSPGHADADPYPLFSRRVIGGTGSIDGEGRCATSSRGSGHSPASPRQVSHAYAREMGGPRPFRIQSWGRSVQTADGAVWYPSPWEFDHDGRAGSGSSDDHRDRVASRRCGSVRDSSTHPTVM